MAPTEILLSFAVATAIFAYMPGPALLYTAAQTLARGRRAGYMAALGIHLGGYVHVIAATLGLSAVFRHVPEAYLAVKLVGAAYLIWLGIGILRRKPEPHALPHFSAKSARRALVESIGVEVLNPKVALFFLAFLPQFVDPGASLPVWCQFLVLGTIVNLTFSSADLVCIALASAVVARARRSGLMERIFRYAGGSLMVGLGAKLALVRD